MPTDRPQPATRPSQNGNAHPDDTPDAITSGHLPINTAEFERASDDPQSLYRVLGHLRAASQTVNLARDARYRTIVDVNDTDAYIDANADADDEEPTIRIWNNKVVFPGQPAYEAATRREEKRERRRDEG